MTGIDSSVLVRYFVRDHPVEAPAAAKFIHGLSPLNPGWLAIAALVETVWVLKKIYRVERAIIAGLIGALLSNNDLVLEQHEHVRQALQLYALLNVDFGDCLISVAAKAAKCNSVVTFDKKAARRLGMELLQ